MSKISDFLSLLDQYIQEQVNLDDYYNQLLMRLQTLTQNVSEDELELISDVLAGLYEVKDGVLDEATYRQSLREVLISDPAVLESGEVYRVG